MFICVVYRAKKLTGVGIGVSEVLARDGRSESVCLKSVVDVVMFDRE